MHPVRSAPDHVDGVSGSARALRAAAALPVMSGPQCDCGHHKQAHEHYRRGTDCALCRCGRFHRSLLTRFGLRSR